MNAEIKHVTKQVLADLTAEELEQRLELQLIRLPEANGWCGCDGNDCQIFCLCDGAYYVDGGCVIYQCLGDLGGE